MRSSPPFPYLGCLGCQAPALSNNFDFRKENLRFHQKICQLYCQAPVIEDCCLLYLSASASTRLPDDLPCCNVTWGRLDNDGQEPCRLIRTWGSIHQVIRLILAGTQHVSQNVGNVTKMIRKHKFSKDRAPSPRDRTLRTKSSSWLHSNTVNMQLASRKNRSLRPIFFH